VKVAFKKLNDFLIKFFLRNFAYLKLAYRKLVFKLLGKHYNLMLLDVVKTKDKKNMINLERVYRN